MHSGYGNITVLTWWGDVIGVGCEWIYLHDFSISQEYCMKESTQSVHINDRYSMCIQLFGQVYLCILSYHHCIPLCLTIS